jgi:hypothetical protein
MDEENDFKLPDDEMKDDSEEDENPLAMDGFHEEGGIEPETDF